MFRSFFLYASWRVVTSYSTPFPTVFMYHYIPLHPYNSINSYLLFTMYHHVKVLNIYSTKKSCSIKIPLNHFTMFVVVQQKLWSISPVQRLGSPFRQGHWRVIKFKCTTYSYASICTGWWCNSHLEKYESQWEAWHPVYYGKKCLKPPTRHFCVYICNLKTTTVYVYTYIYMYVRRIIAYYITSFISYVHTLYITHVIYIYIFIYVNIYIALSSNPQKDR